MRKIFGHHVSSDTYLKYSQRNYSLGDFLLHDLDSVERWATSAELAGRNPKVAAEAKRIMEQITAEITRKDVNDMKKPRTTSDYIDALSKLYDEARGAYTDLQNGLESARAKMERARDDSEGAGQVEKARYSIAAAELTIAENNRTSECKQIMDTFGRKVKALRSEFETQLEDFYAASPDKLDTATLQLLNSGICTPSDLERLSTRHGDNPTMLRIIGSHANNMLADRNRKPSTEDFNHLELVSRRARAVRDGRRELAIFDSAVESAGHGLVDNPRVAARMHDHMQAWFDGYRQQMANLTIAEGSAELHSSTAAE